MHNMASMLESLLSEQLLVEDFKSWLLSDSLKNVSEKADFIPYFLNFLKGNCAWVLTKGEKNLESSTNVLSPSIDNNKHPMRKDIDSSNRITLTDNKCNPIINRVDDDSIEERNKHYDNHEQNHSKDGFKRKGKNFNLPYNNTYKSHGDRSFHNSDCGARKNSNFNTMLNVNQKHTNEYPPDINNYDAFPPMGKCHKNLNDSKMRRRITPTPIQVIQKSSSNFGNSKFVDPNEKIPNEIFKKTAAIEASSSDLQKERELLKMTRNKFSHSQTSMLSNSMSNLKNDNNACSVKNITYVIPDPGKICRSHELDVLSIIYDLLISNALVSNVTAELYFLFELLTAKISSTDKPENKNNIFKSVHNCVYFATSVLSKLKKFLHLLDSNTLSSLCEIPYLHKFSSHLVVILQESLNERQEVGPKSEGINRVPFILEEDSSENFVDCHAFTNFRKQRDLFYELLRDWQQQPLDSIDSQFRNSFSGKVKYLIRLGSNVINLYHLAKLFQNQLIASCLGVEVNEVYDELLTDIQKNFPHKIEKLRQRFMMPFCVGVPNPPPTFYGIQAFFSEFIQTASSATLNQHLQDIFVCKILELNSSDIVSNRGLISVDAMKEKYIFLLHTLRLFGKFLGYLQFLPYKISEPLSANIVSQQIISRKHSVPLLNLPNLLRLAIENNSVILTVPWVTEYLSMIDPVGKCLPYVEESLEILAAIYRGRYFISSESLNFWFIRLIVGWLFDVLCYPSKYYCLIQIMTFEKNINRTGIDFLPLIDKQLVHSCCPYLIEFKILVHGFLSGMKNYNKREIRKITPLSTTKLVASTLSVKQQTQLQLEENFFFLHSPSLKKTVEFVSERIASKIIQKIRTEVTDFKLQSVEYITKEYKTLVKTKEKPINRNSCVDTCILELYEKFKPKILEYINVLCPADIRNIMPSLLSSDIKLPVLNMSCEIAIRIATNKVIDWCNANLILKDITTDIKNKSNHLSKEVDNTKETNVSELLSSLRKLCLKNFCGIDDLAYDYHLLLSKVLSVINKPIAQPTRKLIMFLTVDLYISLMINFPTKLDEENECYFISIWSSYPQNYDLEHYFLGTQNIKYLIGCKNLTYSCEKLCHILTELINKKIFCSKKLEKYLEALKSCQWNDTKANTILHSLTKALKSDDSVSKTKIF